MSRMTKYSFSFQMNWMLPLCLYSFNFHGCSQIIKIFRHYFKSKEARVLMNKYYKSSLKTDYTDLIEDYIRWYWTASPYDGFVFFPLLAIACKYINIISIKREQVDMILCLDLRSLKPSKKPPRFFDLNCHVSISLSQKYNMAV